MENKKYLTTSYSIGSIIEIEKYKHKKVGFVVDENVIKALGLDEKIFEGIYKGCDYKVLCNMMQEPTQALLEPCIKEALAFEPEVLIAIGGGSVLDSAKILWMFLEHPTYDWERAKQVYNIEPFCKNIELVAVPTTSGTGAETTGCAMYTDNEGSKTMFLCDNIIPNHSILDFDLLKSLPKHTIAFSGADALGHALEAGTTILTSEMVKMQSVAASVAIIKNLKASTEGDMEARKKMHIAATMAGACINNSCCGLSHGSSQSGTDFHKPHGLMIGTLLPYTMQKLVPQPLYEEIAEQLGICGTAMEKQLALIEKIKVLFEEIGIPKTLKEAGMDENEYVGKLDSYVEEACGEYNMSNQTAPVSLTKDEYKGLLLEFYYGKDDKS